MNNNTLEEICRVLKEAKRITLIAHRKPDGDSLGACLALHLGLMSMGKQTLLACVDLPARRFSFLPDIEKFHKHFLYDIQDLLVISDAGDSKMSGYHELIPGFLSNQIPILNLDHHISNNYYGKYNYVHPTSASATMIAYEVLRALGVSITKDMATSLLTGIYNDTGGFMHSNTNLRVFQIAAELAHFEADGPLIARNLLLEKPVHQLRTWGLALNRLRRNKENVISSVLTLEDLRQCGASSEETGGVIDLINTVADAKFTVLLAEDEKGFVKGSFRTQKDDVDVAKIAAEFGGGGHRKAAGFRLPGRLREQTVWKIVQS